VASFAVDFFNADDRCAQLNGGSYQGISLALRASVNLEFEQFVEDHIRRGISFAIETTLRSDITFYQMASARARGFELHMLFVALSGFELNLKRVTDRARSGGHSAPAGHIAKIHRASLANLPRAIREVDSLNVYDNSTPAGPPQLVLSAQAGAITFRASPCPDWLEQAMYRTEYEVGE
jgi:predicted ABC-type ATPase